MMENNNIEQVTYETLSNAVNGGFSKKKFLECFKRDHRYLQGEVFSLALAIIEECSKDDYGYDGRNEFAHVIAKNIIETNKQYF